MAPNMEILVFSLHSGESLATAVAQELGLSLAPHEERDFEDGEHKIRPLQKVQGADVYLVQALHATAQRSSNDQLIKLLFFIGALRDAGAGRISLVLPYLCYSRKDRRTKPQDPLSLRYLAQLFEAVGVDRVAVLDVHNPAALENALRRPVRHLSVQPLFLDGLAPLLIDKPVTVAAPDIGGVKRADLFRQALSQRLEAPVETAFVEKRRSEGQLQGDMVAGEVEGRCLVVLDDMIVSGKTILRATAALRAHGAAEIYVAVSHALVTSEVLTALTQAPLKMLLVSNSVPLPANGSSPSGLLPERLQLLNIAPLLAEAIAAMAA